MAVGIGLLLALVLGLLVVQGIFAPVLTRFFGLERAGPAALPLVLLVFAAAFSFYFGGMAASYKAPSRHRLHGILVVPVAFVLSLVLNLVLGKGFLPGVDGALAVGQVVIFLVVSCAASYVGALRGETLYAHNQKVARRRRIAGQHAQALAGLDADHQVPPRVHPGVGLPARRLDFGRVFARTREVDPGFLDPFCRV